MSGLTKQNARRFRTQCKVPPLELSLPPEARRQCCPKTRWLQFFSGNRSEVLRKEVGAIILWRGTWGRGEDWEIKKGFRNNINDLLLDA
jgi:hypothetical protein